MANKHKRVVAVQNYTTNLGKTDLVIDDGDLTLTSGNLALTSGNLTLTSGDLTLTSGNLTLTSGTLTFNGDLTIYDATNDGNPVISLGATATEDLSITATYDSGAQTLDYVEFATAAASATANKGKYIFDVDGTDILSILDAGLVLEAGKTLEFDVASATPAGLLLSVGDSSNPSTTATADKKAMAVYTQSTATSGDSRGLYLKHFLGGTIASTGYGDAIRTWASVTGTGYSYATGCHSTLSIETGATVTGSGSGLRATLGAASESRTLVGALACINADTDIGANNTMPARNSIIRVTKAGTVDVTNFLDIADDQCLKGSAASGAATDALPVIMPDGSTLYISLIAAS